MCNTVFSIAKEGSKSCLCAGSSRARGSKAVRRGAVPPPPPCHGMPPQSCYSFDLAAGAPLIVHSSCRRHCRRRHAKLLCLGGYESAAARRWWRRRRGSVRLGYSKSTQARHWCTATALVQSTTTPPPLPPRRTTLP